MNIAWFATKGSGSNEAERMRVLLSRTPGAVELPFNRSGKARSFRTLWATIRGQRPRLLVMEGTGLAGGLACLGARLFFDTRYVVSSGDAVGPFLRAHHPIAGWAGEIYERLLYRMAAGFIGWTPYLCGRALTFGTRRAVTAPGWVIGGNHGPSREEIRARWGIPANALVVGLAGSLVWNPRRPWCYGLDLVRAAKSLDRRDLAILIVGDGSGLEPLRREAGAKYNVGIYLPGPVPLAEVTAVLRAMDAGSLPQSTDAVGASRYTTKLPEFAAASLPVITNRIPAAYDLGEGWMWRLPGDAPWDPVYQKSLEDFLRNLTPEAIAAKRACIPRTEMFFDREAQVGRVTSFLAELLSEDSRQ